MSTPSATYSNREEWTSASLHALGTLGALVALVLMLVKGHASLSPLQLAGVAVYGCSLIVLFLASTLYHSFRDPRVRAWLKRCDHGAIYLLIAGSYTPLLLITLQGRLAAGLLAAVWILALLGVLFKIFFVHRFKKLSLLAYLGMGWLALIVIVPLFSALPAAAFNLLCISGVCYTAGALFYASKHLEFTHAIWHLFVLAGASCHAVLVGIYVIPS